jgi:hypothetical protein
MRVLAWISAGLVGLGCGSSFEDRVAGLEAKAAPIVASVTLPPAEAIDLPSPSAGAARLIVEPAGVFLDVTPVARAKLTAGDLTDEYLGRLPLPPDERLVALENGRIAGRANDRPDAVAIAELRRALEKLDDASPAAERSRREGPLALVVHADRSIPAVTVRDVVFTGEDAGFVVSIAVASGSETRAIHLAAPRPDLRLGDSLDLRLFVAEDGHRVSGAGGTLTPGCEEVSSAPAVTIPRTGTGYDFAALRRCLELVKMRFENDRRMTVRAHPSLAHGDLVRTLLAGASGESELFPEITLGRDPPIAADVPE